MFNVAIVGIGNISSAHINGLLEFPERAKIVALCDIYPEKAEAAKKKDNLTELYLMIIRKCWQVI